jgi:Ca2+-binding EF-hand superfamily protein
MDEAVLGQTLDTSQDGWIIGRELRNRLKKLGLVQHASEILRMMDVDGDSRISFDEFVSGYEKVWATKVRTESA